MDRNWNLGLNIKRWVSPGRYKCLGYLREMKRSRDENIKKQVILLQKSPTFAAITKDYSIKLKTVIHSVNGKETLESLIRKAMRNMARNHGKGFKSSRAFHVLQKK